MKHTVLKRVALPFAAIAFSLCLTRTAVAADTELKITAIDIYTHGDATMLESRGKHLLMDTGYNSFEKNGVTYDTQLFDYLDTEGITSFDIYLSHFHPDHYDNILGILNSDKYTVSTLYLPLLPNLYTEDGIESHIADIADASYKDETRTALTRVKTRVLDAIIQKANEKGINIVKLKKGDRFNFGDARIEIIGPDSDIFPTISQLSDLDEPRGHWLNSTSLAARITVDKTVFLTLGDTEAFEEALLLQSGQNLKADIMKISHHGSQTSSTEEFLRAVNPTYTYLQVYGNSTTIMKNFAPFTRINSLANINSNAWNGQITYTITNNTINVDTKRHSKIITIEYYDENNQLITSETAMPDEGTNYFLESRAKRTIDGYTYLSTEGETTGIASEDKVIKSYYLKDPDTTPEESETAETTEPEKPVENPKTADNFTIILTIIVMCSAATALGYAKLAKRR